jgi:hypothetical protein
MKRTASSFNDDPMRNRLFNRSSTGPPRPPKSPRYMRRIRAAPLLRAMLQERRTRRRYSIGTKSSCSNNSSNGGSARRTCRKEPTLTPVLFAKPSTRPRRRIWVLRHPASSTSWAGPFGRAAPIGHAEIDRSTGRWHRLTCQGPEGSRERFAEPTARTSSRIRSSRDRTIVRHSPPSRSGCLSSSLAFL